MKRTSNSRSSLFLIELIIAILFFSLVSAVCLRAFARSHILTENARDLNAALMHVESTAELLRAGGHRLSTLLPGIHVKRRRPLI